MHGTTKVHVRVVYQVYDVPLSTVKFHQFIDTYIWKYLNARWSESGTEKGQMLSPSEATTANGYPTISTNM